MEEIDIIELLKRVKEGKAPKKIEVAGYIYVFEKLEQDYYRVGIDDGYYNLVDEINIFDMFDTKIKILDKSIIEELPIIIGYESEKNKTLIQKNRDKINEIIKWINKENKDE